MLPIQLPSNGPSFPKWPLDPNEPAHSKGAISICAQYTLREAIKKGLTYGNLPLIFGSYETGATHLTACVGVCTKCVALLWIESDQSQT